MILPPPALPSLKVGDRAPDVGFRRADGSTLRLNSLKGKVVAIQFTSSGCSTCRRLAARFEELSGKRPNVVFLVVSIDPVQATPRLMSWRSEGARTLLVRDVEGALGRFGAQTAPTMAVVGRDGRMASRLMRGGTGDLPRLEARIAWASRRPSGGRRGTSARRRPRTR